MTVSRHRALLTARVRVWSPDGLELPAAHPPAVPAGPSLDAQHRSGGLGLGPETLAYCGAPFDLGMTIDCLLRTAYPVAGEPRAALPVSSGAASRPCVRAPRPPAGS